MRKKLRKTLDKREVLLYLCRRKYGCKKGMLCRSCGGAS